MNSSLGVRWVHAERMVCILLIGWLQYVGIRTNSVVHHILHAVPLAVLLLVPTSPARHLTGMLAGLLWVFMLGVISPMLFESLILGGMFTQTEVPYMWLAPIAALLAVVWAVVNATLLMRRPRVFAQYLFLGLGGAALLAALHPYLSMAFAYPLDKAIEGNYQWTLVLILEAMILLAFPGWCAFRWSPDLRADWSLAGWQVIYWVFFVFMMVAGLLPRFN